MGLRDLARKGLGLLVELPDEPAAPQPQLGAQPQDNPETQALRKKSLSELMAEMDRPVSQEPHAPAVTFDAPPPDALQGDQVDFAAVYGQAGVPPLAFTAEQTLELIRSLPADLPLATKRQTLDASLNTLGRAMNVSKDQVLVDAHHKLQALAAYEEAARVQRDAAVSAMQQRVQELQAQIDAERQKAAAAETQYQTILKQCEVQGDLLDEVQEFLTLDEGTSRLAGS